MKQFEISVRGTNKKKLVLWMRQGQERKMVTAWARLSPLRRGAILAVTLVCLLVVFTVGGLLLRAHVQQRRQIRLRERQIQAAWLADSALSRARAQLDLSPEYTGENWPATGETATAEIRVERVAGADQSRRIVVEARLTDVPEHPLVQRRELVYPLASSGASP